MKHFFDVLLLFLSCAWIISCSDKIEPQTESPKPEEESSAIEITKKIKALEDTYVFSNGGSENAVLRQFSNPEQLKTYTHQSLDTWTYRTYLKFDLSTINTNPDFIQKVVFKIIGKEDQGSFQHGISVYALSEDSWTEDELSYNNRGTTGEAVKIATVTKTIGSSDEWFDFDITAKVKEYKVAGKNTLSLMLSDDTNVRNPNNNQGSIVTFYSKDATGENYPRLVVDETVMSDLLLSYIGINGDTLTDFAPERFYYEVGIDQKWTQVPTIEATPVNSGATVNIVNASALTGTVENRTATITVSKGALSINYKIILGSSSVSNDALLKILNIDGGAIEFFNSKTYTYNYYYPYTQTTGPNITWSSNSPNQQITLNGPNNIFSTNETDRVATIQVTSADGQNMAEYKIIFQVLPKLDLYLCIGQSNMAGRGYMDASQGDLIPLENSYLFTPKYRFEKANNPMNQYSNIRKELSLQEISPAWGFAKYVNDNFPQIKIGIIVNARGGSAMEEWQKSQPLYNSTITRAKEALKWGEFKAILWHQGESNSASAKVAAYPAQLTAMVNNLRNDLSSPNAFFIAGELIHSYSGAPNFNPMIQTIASFLENSDWISAEGLTPRASGDVHFSRQSNITLGERYAEKIIEKYYSSEN